jgi:hypothetical protein
LFIPLVRMVVMVVIYLTRICCGLVDVGRAASEMYPLVLYQTVLEREVLRHTREFYLREAVAAIDGMGVLQYVPYVRARSLSLSYCVALCHSFSHSLSHGWHGHLPLHLF